MTVRPYWAAALTAASLTTLADTDPRHAGDLHLEEVIVSAPLTRSASQTALPISVLSGEQLRREAASNLGDTLSNEIGIHSASFGNGVGNPVIRGQGGNRVRILQDGIGTLDAADVSPDHSFTAEPLLADRIEIIRGPATLLYGNGAIGGVINVIDSRIPSAVPEKLTGAIETRHATVNDQNSSVFRLDGGADQLAWHLDGLYRESNNLDIPGSAIDTTDLDEPPEENTRGFIGNSNTRADAWTAGLSWVSDNGYTGLAISELNNNYGLPPGAHEGHEHEEEAGGAEEHEEEEAVIRLDMEQQRVDLKSSYRLSGPVSSVDFRFSRNDYEHRELEKTPEETEVGTRYKNKASEARLILRHAAIGSTDRSQLSGALGLQLGDRDFSAVGEEAFIPPANIRQHAIFLVEELAFDRWTYEFGLRHEQQQVDIDACDRDHSTLSASASALWNFRDDSNLLVALNRSERAATVEELFSNSRGCNKPADLSTAVEHAATARIEIGDPDLDKELSHNLELGLRKTAGDVTGEISVYYNEIQNFTYLQDTGAEVDEVEVAAYQQRNAAFSGYELRLIAPLKLINEALSVELFSDQVRARFTEGSGNVPRIPAQRFGAALHYHANQWSTHLRVTQVRDQDNTADNETATGGYTLVELGGDYHIPLSKNLELTLFVKGRNLLDEKVRSHTSLLKNFAPEAGRNIESGIRLAF